MIATVAWLLQAAHVPAAIAPADRHPLPHGSLTGVLPGCRVADVPGDIVVCGRRSDRYRLPLRDQRTATNRVAGEAKTGVGALTPSGRCGIFAGERSCSKREAAEYGYGNGRDPVTVIGRLARKVFDPDAD